jgi:regulator of protease activity HflC (stomatin/prohibitin superfamily)
MAPLAFFKAEPTEYILAYRNGNVFRQGAGRSFWYWKPTTSIMLIPLATSDALFALNETTGNFQAITLQGQITYRIADPLTISKLLNFTINPTTRQYNSEDPDQLSQRVINVVQAQMRAELRQLTLEDALRSADTLAEKVLGKMQQEHSLSAMGVECVSLFITSIKPTPEMAKALEAEYREALQKRADQAIFSRRADAVEQERKIKQNELSTAVDLEERRRELVELQSENARRQAEVEAETTRVMLEPYQGIDKQLMLALAFRDFANNASKIGNLTITSEILERLLRDKQ